jgi:hypothetical protein
MHTELARGFEQENLSVPSEREDMNVLDDRSIDKFLNRLSKYKTSKHELSNILMNAVQSDEYHDYLDFVPSLLINFEEQKLY